MLIYRILPGNTTQGITAKNSLLIKFHEKYLVQDTFSMYNFCQNIAWQCTTVNNCHKNPFDNILWETSSTGYHVRCIILAFFALLYFWCSKLYFLYSCLAWDMGSPSLHKNNVRYMEFYVDFFLFCYMKVCPNA